MHLEEYDESCNEDAKTLNEVADHMDVGRSNINVLAVGMFLLIVVLVSSVGVTVLVSSMGMTVLMQS